VAASRSAQIHHGRGVPTPRRALLSTTRQWGIEGQHVWYEAATWRGYAAIKDIETARELSATIGEYGVLGWSEGDNTGSHGKAFEAGSRSRSSTVTYQEISRPLIRPEEIMHDLRDDAMIVVPKKAARCSAAGPSISAARNIEAGLPLPVGPHSKMLSRALTAAARKPSRLPAS
jgi:hypothetical protein